MEIELQRPEETAAASRVAWEVAGKSGNGRSKGLSVCRITDNGSKVLSIKRLPRMTKVAPRDELAALTEKLEAAGQPARDARDRYIAHLEFEVLRNPTLHDAIIPEREPVLNAIKAIDDLMHFVDHHFTKANPVMWEHLDMLGGAAALHDIVRRGLRDREERLPSIP